MSTLIKLLRRRAESRRIEKTRASPQAAKDKRRAHAQQKPQAHPCDTLEKPSLLSVGVMFAMRACFGTNGFARKLAKSAFFVAARKLAASLATALTAFCSLAALHSAAV